MADQAPAGAAQAAPADPATDLRQAAQTLAALAWLERDYDQPDRFLQPDSHYYAHLGMFQIYPDHDPDECLSCSEGFDDTKRGEQ